MRKKAVEPPPRPEPIEIEFTVKAKVQPDAMFLRVLGATIEEGEFKDSTYATNIGSGAPILSITRNGKSLTTSWLPLQDLLSAWIAAVVADERVAL